MSLIGSQGLSAYNAAVSQYAQQQQYLGPVRDSRPVRVRLEELRDRNAGRMKELQAQNDEIASALALLDDHPYVEKIGDAVRRILG